MYKIDYPPYTHQEFPTTKYHKEKPPLLVKNKEEAELLEKHFPGDWKDSPADFGIITAPSSDQTDADIHGFSFDELRSTPEPKKVENETSDEIDSEEKPEEPQKQPAPRNRNRRG